MHNPLIEYNNVTKNRAALGYNFAPQPKYYQPFKKLFKSKTHWFDLIKDFNFNPVPSQLSFRADVFRQFGVLKPRSVGVTKYTIPETFDKYYTFDRYYIFRWDPTHSLNIDYSAVNNARVDEPYGRLDTKEKKDTVRKNLFDGGRNVVFTQTANFSYNVPTTKFPLIDWTTLQVKYSASYRWLGASRLAVNLGNFLENGQQEQANLQLDFNKLYSKSKWLRALDQQPLPQQPKDTSNKKGVKSQNVPKDPNALPQIGGVARFFGKLLTSVKGITATISQNSNTRLPGYTDSTQFVGQNFKSMAPGFDFILGRQPDSNWLNRAAKRGLITKDTLFNEFFRQTFDQHFSLSAQVEPFRDFTIDVNLDKTFNKIFRSFLKIPLVMEIISLI